MAEGVPIVVPFYGDGPPDGWTPFVRQAIGLMLRGDARSIDDLMVLVQDTYNAEGVAGLVTETVTLAGLLSSAIGVLWSIGDGLFDVELLDRHEVLAIYQSALARMALLDMQDGS